MTAEHPTASMRRNEVLVRGDHSEACRGQSQQRGGNCTGSLELISNTIPLAYIDPHLTGLVTEARLARGAPAAHRPLRVHIRLRRTIR